MKRQHSLLPRQIEPVALPARQKLYALVRLALVGLKTDWQLAVVLRDDRGFGGRGLGGLRRRSSLAISGCEKNSTTCALFVSKGMNLREAANLHRHRAG